MSELKLSAWDGRMLGGEAGETAAMAMRILVAMARVQGAERLIDVASAHVDACLYHGQVSLDFAERLASGGAQVAVPTTLNVGALDLVHPDRFHGDPETGRRARRLMDLYAAMGCRPTFTCAPYQIPDARPAFGQHVAWAESNAIAFANSVLGARTDRYGDFIDVCAAVTGRAPLAGLHLDANRRARVLFRVHGIGDRLLREDIAYPLLGHLVGARAGARVPAIQDVPPQEATEDRLKALGAGAASSGAVGLFHVVGATPEAPTLEAALAGVEPEETVEVSAADLAAARDELSTSPDGPIDAVSLGTPHLSIAEFERLLPLFEGFRLAAGVELYLSTGRDVLEEVRRRGWTEALDRAGAKLVVDTCTYVTPIIRKPGAVVMTNSAKWAFYGPGNLGVGVVFGSTAECVRSAMEGRVWRDARLWR